MVYFIGHTIYNKRSGNWIGITNIPFRRVNMNEDLSFRKLNIDNPSLQFLWQPSVNFMPLFPVLIKTNLINKIKINFKDYIKKKKKYMNHKYLIKREIGIFNL